MMRDFLICEILIPNAQRTEIITGLEIREVNTEQNNVLSGHNVIVVANHKTGCSQRATIFVPLKIFTCLTVFIQHVLPKLPVYLSKTKTLHDYSPVFQSYAGFVINSSLVSPIVRRGLLDLDIPYKGSVNDIRSAVTTLTASQNPAFTENMAQLMSRSQKIHDKSSHMVCGNYSLLYAFISQEKMQTYPIHPIIDPNSSSLVPSIFPPLYIVILLFLNGLLR